MADDHAWGRRRGYRRGCGRYGTFGAPPSRCARDDVETSGDAKNTTTMTGRGRRGRWTYLRSKEGRTAAEGAREVVLGDVNAPGMTWVKIVRKPPVPSDVREATWTPASARDDARDFIRENKREAMGRARLGGDNDDDVDDDVDNNDEVFHAEHGHVPAYLVRMNREREDARRLEEETRAKIKLEEASRGRMSEDEKQSLIMGLRREYDAINASYQKLPFVVDTPSRRARKEAHEVKLERIERDIEILSAKNVFFINV